VWKAYEFTWQMDAILFWERFEGRWLRRHGVSLSRAASEFAVIKAPRELAEIQSTQSAISCKVIGLRRIPAVLMLLLLVKPGVGRRSWRTS